MDESVGWILTNQWPFDLLNDTRWDFTKQDFYNSVRVVIASIILSTILGNNNRSFSIIKK